MSRLSSSRRRSRSIQRRRGPSAGTRGAAGGSRGARSADRNDRCDRAASSGLTAEFEAEREERGHGEELEGTQKCYVDTPRGEAARARGAVVGRLRAEGASASLAEALAEARPRAPEQVDTSSSSQPNQPPSSTRSSSWQPVRSLRSRSWRSSRLRRLRLSLLPNPSSRRRVWSSWCRSPNRLRIRVVRAWSSRTRPPKTFRIPAVEEDVGIRTAWRPATSDRRRPARS